MASGVLGGLIVFAGGVGCDYFLSHRLSRTCLAADLRLQRVPPSSWGVKHIWQAFNIAVPPNTYRRRIFTVILPQNLPTILCARGIWLAFAAFKIFAYNQSRVWTIMLITTPFLLDLFRPQGEFFCSRSDGPVEFWHQESFRGF